MGEEDGLPNGALSGDEMPTQNKDTLSTLGFDKVPPTQIKPLYGYSNDKPQHNSGTFLRYDLILMTMTINKQGKALHVIPPQECIRWR